MGWWMNIWGTFIGLAAWGLLCGALAGVSFLRGDSNLHRLLGAGAVTAAPMAPFFAIARGLNVSGEHLGTAFAAALVGILVGFATTVIYFLRRIEPGRALAWELLLATEGGLKRHFDRRDQLANREEELTAREARLDEKQREVTRRESNVSSRETLASHAEDRIARAESGVWLDVVTPTRIALDPTTASDFTRLAAHVAVFGAKMDFLCRIASQEWQDQLSNVMRKKAKTAARVLAREEQLNRIRADITKGFLVALCEKSAEHLISENNGIRAHVRVRDEQTYRCLHYYERGGTSGDGAAITPVPIGSGLLGLAQTQQRSVVKSLNPSQHFAGQHDNVWIDYITIPILVSGAGLPFLFLTIALKYPQSKTRLLCLSHARIEAIVEACVGSFHQQVGLRVQLANGTYVGG